MAATSPAPATRRAPRQPVPKLSLAHAASCGIEDAITVAGARSFERPVVGDQVVVMMPMQIREIHGNELVLNGPSGNRRVDRRDIVRHVEVTR